MNRSDDPDIEVTRIGNRWHSRLMYRGKVHDEMACELKCDIGWISREMLRWFSKLGSQSAFAHSARIRQAAHQCPSGKVWHRKQLETENVQQSP